MDDDTRSFGTGAGYSEDEGAGGAGGGAGGAEPKEFVVKERKHRKIEGEKTIKPKRLKTHGITSGTYQIPHVPRNPDGTPRLPIPIGIMILRKLGTVTPREHFHTERYIFPIGFEAMRKYPSMIDRTETVEYSCTIVDGGDGAPRFEIHPADQPGVIISAGTPTGAWSQVVKAANRVRERNHSNSVSGPDYYGLAQNVVKALIQELPGAREVPGYIWQTFLE
ncbi:F/Y-rich N-terminus-domain-containing protein, partial [Leucosporidium creatinivorum]